ncbi:MAG TPA: glycosyltransferase family 4 protein [Candidatus Cloacimonadota bacterium]|nr:glycosyltransferase family 4 protein [Candidatus Cloacimonadota bacterium]
MKKPKTLLITPNDSTFTRVDAKLLSQSCKLETYDLRQHKGRLGYFWRIMGCIFRILLCRYQLIFIWFADYHAAVAVFLAKLLKTPSVVFIGGYDAVCYPELQMGVYCSPFRSKFASFALKNCSLIISNHEALLDSSNTFYNPNGHPEGVFRLVKDLKTPARVIYNALTVDVPEAELLTQERELVFLAVGTTPRYLDIFNKGLELVAQMAVLFPEYRFEIVGIDPKWQEKFIELLGGVVPENLSLRGYIPHAEVLALMRSSRYYIQASISEGMPNALMEAMLMGCLPIGSNVAGIPTIIGEYGVVFDKRDAESLRQALVKALELKLQPLDISKHVATSFSQEIRGKLLQQIVQDLQK